MLQRLATSTCWLNSKNLNLLIKQVENDKIRRDRGQITNTDVAQSEASLAGAQAQFVKSKSDLLISKLNYENIIGIYRRDEMVQLKHKELLHILNESDRHTSSFSEY